MDITPVQSKNFLFKAPYRIKEEIETISAIPSEHYLIELEACGLCHSDLLWMAHRSKDWEKIGHEFGGKVRHCGDNTSKFQPGQQVAVKNAAPCGVCDHCTVGKARDCGDVIVNKSGFNQFFLAHERSMVDAEGLEGSLLGLVEPLGVANDVLKAAQIRPKDRVTIYGLGAIGLMAGWLCIQKGASGVYGCARSSKCFDLAEQFGFKKCFKPGEINETISNKILVFAPPGTLKDAVTLLMNDGLIVIAGLNDSDWDHWVPFNFESLIFKRASIIGAFGYPNLFFEDAVEQLKSGKDSLRQIITHQISFSNTPGLKEELLQSPDCIKAVFINKQAKQNSEVNA